MSFDPSSTRDKLFSEVSEILGHRTPKRCQPELEKGQEDLAGPDAPGWPAFDGSVQLSVSPMRES